MNIFKRVAGLFSVTEDEVRSFRLLFLQSLFIGFANSYYYIVSSTFLLKHVEVKYLPNSYIITGAAGFLLMQLYKTVQRKRGISTSFRMALIIFTLVCFLNFFGMLKFAHDKTFALALAYFMVLFAPPFTAIFSLGLFAQCSRLYNIAQSKRLVALVLSGEIFSSVLAFMSISLSGGFIKGREYVLLPAAGIFTLLVFIPFNKILKIGKEKFHLAAGGKDARKINFSFFRKDKFFLLIAIVTLFSVFAVYVIDYAYLISVRCMANYTGFEIAQIAAVFLFVVKLGELTFSFLSGKILSSRGVKFSLLLLPVILLLVSSFAFISGFVSRSSGIPIFLLAFLFMGKLADRAIRKSITTPSLKVMYQVAEPSERLDIEASIDGLLNQIGVIISGVLLLAISLFFFGTEMVSLLHLFSFVCIVAFAIWSFFSFRMYDNYRVKIKEFLSKIKSKRPVLQDVGNGEIAHDELLQQGDGLQLTEQVDFAVNTISNASKEDLLKLIKIYNQKQLLDFTVETDDKIAKRLIHIYYGNNFYFSRLLIIRYLKYCSSQTSLVFLRDLWEVSDLTSRLELMISFNELKHQQTDHAFFERQCEECVKEIIWADSAIFDTSVLKDDALDKELNHHRSMLIRLLFELLKPIYEPSVIQVISDIITNEKEDIEGRLFALELLDITLLPGLKEIIKPILEPISFEDKSQKLKKFFHIYQLTPQERLVDILMKDYNLVNLRLKETALILYNKVAENKDALAAFRHHSIDNLKYKADEFYSGYRNPVYQAKIELIKRLENTYSTVRPYAPYLFNYAIFAPKHNKFDSTGYLNRMSANRTFFVDMNTNENQNGNVAIRLDSLAIALLITLKHKN